MDLSEIDTVFISHGHMDHGGALRRFLKINQKAKVYVQRQAFERHSSKFLFFRVDVGLDDTLKSNPQIILVDGDSTIDEELSLFTVKNSDACYSNANDSLYEGRLKDPFLHEQNLVIREKTTAVFTGCGHAGIVNIMEKAAAFTPEFCIGGYHLMNPLSKKTVGDRLLDQIALALSKYPQMHFYTCHCTGKSAYEYLSARLANMHNLSCGDVIELGRGTIP